MDTYHGRPLPAPFERYHHFKGKDYQVIALATKEDDGQQLVIYQALYDDHKIWARSLDSFLGKIDRSKYPGAAQPYRFERIEEETEPGVEPSEAGAQDAQGQNDENHPEDGDPTGIDSRILDFLDADSNRERIDILRSLHSDITDAMIDTLAAASGLEIGPGPVESRYLDLRDCLLTISRYELEGNRLR